MIEIGCSTLGFRFEPLAVALDEIAAQGFRRVDIVMIGSYCPHFDPVGAGAAEEERLAEGLAARRLAVATLNTGDGLLGRPGDRERALRHARASLRLAHRLGAYAITIQSGVEPPPGQWLEVARDVASDVRELAAAAADLGLDLTLELHRAMLMATCQQALDLMALVDRPNVGVALDPSHITHAGERADEVAQRLGRWVKHVHLRDAVGTNILVVPGDGTVDFAALARALARIGYQRTAAIELEYEQARAPEVRADLARAKAVVERAFQAA